MFFSVVIPAFNEEKYIGKLLDSLVNQGFKDFEVIVSDGDSEDGTKEVVETYYNKLPLNFISSKERGPANQRNNGARLAKGDNILFLDSDCYVRPDFLRKVHKVISRSNCKAIIGFMRPDEKRLVFRIFYFFNNLFIFLSQFFKPGANGAFMMIERNLFNEVGGFDPEVKWAEDAEFFRRVKDVYSNNRVYPNLVVTTSTRRFHSEGVLSYSLRVLEMASKAAVLDIKKATKNVVFEYGHHEKNISEKKEK
jgi:glycosyltransferase involved in cell wall biosynthesis